MEPMLLALSMELALKAWCVFDKDRFEFKRKHDLAVLYDELLPASQSHLDREFKRSVAPRHPNMFYVDYGIRDVLFQHKDAFTDWRYLFDQKKVALNFNQSAFEATLENITRHHLG